MTHFRMSSPPVGCESLPLFVQFVHWTKTSGVGDKWELKSSQCSVGQAVFSSGVTSAQGVRHLSIICTEAPFVIANFRVLVFHQ